MKFQEEEEEEKHNNSVMAIGNCDFKGRIWCYVECLGGVVGTSCENM